MGAVLAAPGTPFADVPDRLFVLLKGQGNARQVLEAVAKYKGQGCPDEVLREAGRRLMGKTPRVDWKRLRGKPEDDALIDAYFTKRT